MAAKQIEILPVGPDGTLFQVCDGKLFGLLEMDDTGMPWDDVRERITLHPDVTRYLRSWLNANGVLVGSQHAPHLSWHALEEKVPIARLL